MDLDTPALKKIGLDVKLMTELYGMQMIKHQVVISTNKHFQLLQHIAKLYLSEEYLKGSVNWQVSLQKYVLAIIYDLFLKVCSEAYQKQEELRGAHSFIRENFWYATRVPRTQRDHNAKEPSSFIPYPAPLQFKINNFHTGVVSRLETARECKNPNHFAPLENSEISANYLTFYLLKTKKKSAQ